jgi:hypothetical protein
MITTVARRVFIENIREIGSGEVLLKGWIYRLRVLGKTAFVILRDCSGEAQCVIASQPLKDHRLKLEDVVEIQGNVRAEPRSKNGFEVDIAEIRVLNRATQNLPFQSSADLESIGLETLVQYRPLALRTEAVGDVFRMQAALLACFREALNRRRFTETVTGSRTTTHTVYAVIQAAQDLKRQIAEKGLPQGNDIRTGSATPDPTIKDAARYAFAAHFAEVEVDTELGHVRVTKYVAVHDSGRIVNPLTAASQVKGGATMGIGMALHEELLHDRQSGLPLTAGYYGARVMTHRDTPEIDVLFVETEDAYGPFGAKSIGESTIVPSVAAIANAIFNATGRRIKDLPITRDKILGVLA